MKIELYFAKPFKLVTDQRNTSERIEIFHRFNGDRSDQSVIACELVSDFHNLTPDRAKV